jgi:hypothetical protein
MNTPTVLCCLSFGLLALGSRAQTPVAGSTTPAAVIDRGPFWRTWSYGRYATSAATGQISLENHQYQELGDGLCYWNNGV